MQSFDHTRQEDHTHINKINKDRSDKKKIAAQSKTFIIDRRDTMLQEDEDEVHIFKQLKLQEKPAYQLIRCLPFTKAVKPDPK